MVKGPRRKTRDSRSVFTYSDYCLLPDDGKRYEIIDGELHNAPAPYVRHQVVLRNLGGVLEPYCRQNAHGELLYAPVDVVLSDIDVVQPDIIWISNENRRIITMKNIQGVPDLVVEIVSPHTKRKDEELKVKLYQRFGVKEYWLIDPEGGVLSLYRLRGKLLELVQKYSDVETFKSRCFPGLKIDLKRVFEG